MKIIKYTSKELDKISQRYLGRKRVIQERVAKIIDDVRLQGDDALIRYTKKFDKVELSTRELKVTESEISGAYQNISANFISSLKVIIENVTRFYKKQYKKSWKIKDQDGVILGERIEPLDTVGIYIPAGSAPLVSSVYMTALPAKIAGVKRIVLVTPPGKDSCINPHILVVADLLKVTEIYKVGGAQAIAALTFGTKTIPAVDKIIGPGNQYVTEAKRQVYGYTSLDMIAGPTELVIIANRSSPADYVIADLKAQNEHYGGLSILITNSKSLAKQVKNEVKNGYVVLTQNLDQAADVSDKIAPEHLEILIRDPSRVFRKIKNAGAIFLGFYSPVAVGDYVAGPSHVLPTGGSARFFSGLRLEDFFKSSHIISYSKKALEKIRDPLEKIAGIEGLNKHFESVRVRLGQSK